MKIEKCILGGGCFWCLDASFRIVKGVSKVVCGYTGGTSKNPTYKQVCTGNTGHAEVIEITFDSDTISFEKLLQIFFTIHDPTTLNRQGSDIGTQYRSIITFQNQNQEKIANGIITRLTESRAWNGFIVTKLEPLDIFYPAEPYHQDYFSKNPESAYCQMVVRAKISKLTKNYNDLLI